jgi:hypothetical protein
MLMQGVKDRLFFITPIGKLSHQNDGTPSFMLQLFTALLWMFRAADFEEAISRLHNVKMVHAYPC